MKEHLITGNVVEGEFQIDKPEPVKGFIVGDKIIYQDGWDILDRVKHSIVKIYEAPIVNDSSWCFRSATDEMLVCVWEKIAITEFEEAMLKNLKKMYQYITRDLDGSLWVHEWKPYKNINESCWKSVSWCCEMPFSNVFQMIQWENKKPTKISDLIGEEN